MTAFTILTGLPVELRPEAVAIYWQAFGGKLGRVLGPEDRATQFLNETMSARNCLVAVSPDGQLLGIAGYKTAQGAFTGGSPALLRRIYGRWGALWRQGVLRLLESDTDNRRFLVDGICVRRESRGMGVGTALLEGLCAEARQRGFAAIRLDVVDTNRRARALYERQGFMAVGDTPIGWLRHVFGFAAATTMVKPLDMKAEARPRGQAIRPIEAAE
jgi:ribosomal protein S18 acetylase RimI-like enzyme